AGGDGMELWKSDGTDDGTVLVKDIVTGSNGSNPSNLTNVNGALFFRANDGINGDELWTSDGSDSGTVLITDIHSGSYGSRIYGTDPSDLTNVNGELFFSAKDGVKGYELWKSDGSPSGTVLINDIRTGSLGSYPFNLTNVNGVLFFGANDGVHGNGLW